MSIGKIIKYFILFFLLLATLKYSGFSASYIADIDGLDLEGTIQTRMNFQGVDYTAECNKGEREMIDSAEQHKQDFLAKGYSDCRNQYHQLVSAKGDNEGSCLVTACYECPNTHDKVTVTKNYNNFRQAYSYTYFTCEPKEIIEIDVPFTSTPIKYTDYKAVVENKLSVNVYLTYIKNLWLYFLGWFS